MKYVTHVYTRTMLSNNQYNINNSERVDGEGNQIYLSKEIEASFPNKKFLVRCNHTSLKILVKEADDFTAGEKTTLDQLIQDHKDNA